MYMPELPFIKGTYRHVLRPPGMASAQQVGLKAQWYVNDHCFVVDASERIHWFGITNPYPQDGNFYGPGSHRHIGHAVASHPFGPWEELPDAFTLPEATTEYIGACFVVPMGEAYLMTFGYNTGFQFAWSSDLTRWASINNAPRLNLGEGTRDPCILRLADGTHLLYAAAGYRGRSAVVLASSDDLLLWRQEPPALFTDIAISWGALESPYIHRRGDNYYLFVNHSHRQYSETLVYHSCDPREFNWETPLCTLFAHAAEVLEWRGRTYISHCGIEDRHWLDSDAPFGLWLAELGWISPEP
jgi:hypothetical protein